MSDNQYNQRDMKIIIIIILEMTSNLVVYKVMERFRYNPVDKFK